MTEYTPKLNFPIPAVTRGGDVNDVEDIVDTIEILLNYIDSGTGNYNFSVAYGEQLVEQTLNGGVVTSFPDIASVFSVPPPPEDTATPGYPDKLTWTESGETDFVKINEDGTILIKAAGIYNISPSIAWTTNDTEGYVVADLHRTDVDGDINNAHIFKVYEPITGTPLGNESYLGLPSLADTIGPNFYQKDTIITPRVYVSNESASIELQVIGISVERL